MNQQLVKGAALIGQSNRSTWNQAFQKNLNASLAEGAKRQMVRKAEKARANAKTAGYIESLNSNVDTTSLSSSQQQAVSNYLTDQKMLYADAARRISKLDPTHPEYMAVRDEMNAVQMNFTNLAGSLNQYKEDKSNYLEDFDNSLLSAVGIGDGGVLNFWNDTKGEYKKYQDIDKPFLKDTKSADGILQLNEQLYNSGKELNGTRRNMVRQKLNNMVSSGGRDTLLSLASDDFIIEGGLGLQDPTLFEKENEAFLKEAVLDGYMSVLEDSASQGAIDNRPKVSGGGRGAGGRKTLQEEIPVVNDAFAFSQMSTNVAPGDREAKTRLLVQEINAIDPTKAGNYYSRGDFYNMWLDGVGEDDSNEAREIFVNTYGDSQIFLFNEKDPERSMPIKMNTDNPQDLYEFYLKNSNLNTRAQNYHIGQYDGYKNQSSKQNTNQKNNTESSGSYDNL